MGRVSAGSAPRMACRIVCLFNHLELSRVVHSSLMTTRGPGVLRGVAVVVSRQVLMSTDQVHHEMHRA